MRRLISVGVSVAALFVWVPAITWAEGLSPQVTAMLCQEKKAGLAKLEAEAPGLHAQVAKLEKDYAAASMAETEAMGLAGNRIRTGSSGFVGDTVDKGAFGLVGAATILRESVAKQLASVKARETYVGSQIFLLRDIIEGLGCDKLPVAAPQRPAVDFGAIERLGQESREQGYGGGTSPTSGSFSGSVVGGPGYREPAASSTPGAAQAPAGGPGYGPYGPYGPGVGMVPVPGYPVPPPGYPMPAPGSPAQPCGGAGAGDCPPPQHREQPGGPCH
jgi:hypothetical protein